MYKKINQIREIFFDRFFEINKSAITKNAIALYTIQIAEFILPLMIIPRVVKMIGMSGFGVSSFVLSFISFFSTLVDYGFSLSSTREISVNRNNNQKINEVFSNTIWAKMFLFFIGALLLIILIQIFPKLKLIEIYIYVAYMALVGNIFFPTWLYQGMENMKFLAYSNLFIKILMIIAVFLFINPQNGIFTYLLIITIAQIANGLICFYNAKIKFNVHIEKPSWIYLKKSLASGWALFLSNASLSLYSTGNSFLLGLFVTSVEVGYYSAAEKIIKAGIAFIGPLSQAIYPRFAKLAVDAKNLFFIYSKKIFFYMGLFGFALSLAIYILCPIAVKVLFGSNFEMTILLIRIMSPIPLMVSLSNVLGTQIMLPLGRDQDFTKILFLGGVLNISIVLIFAHVIGSSASALALLFTETFITISMFYYINTKIRGKI